MYRGVAWIVESLICRIYTRDKIRELKLRRTGGRAEKAEKKPDLVLFGPLSTKVTDAPYPGRSANGVV